MKFIIIMNRVYAREHTYKYQYMYLELTAVHFPNLIRFNYDGNGNLLYHFYCSVTAVGANSY